MKTAVRQMVLSAEQINPSPNSLFLPAVSGIWSTYASTLSSDGIISEDGTNYFHPIARQSPTRFILQNNQPYRWTVWVRPLNRRFCYLTIAPQNGDSRVVSVWGLDGQGLLDRRQMGTTIINDSFSYKKIQQGICKLTFNFTITTGSDLQVPLIGPVDKFPPLYTSFFDITYQGLNQPSIQVLANECLPV